MIITEFYLQRKDGVKLYRRYSDKQVYLLQNETGIKYGEAVDVENAPYTYTETNESIEEETQEVEDNE